MPQKILDVLLLGRCSHEFSWPRRAADGEYYQVCLLCATEFRYDWSTMRRTERLKKDAESAQTTSKRRAHSTSSWVPRARRIKMDAPLRYRVKNLGTWNEGIIENTLVEMVFEMPEVISGQKNSKVLCQGRVIRMKNGRDKEPELQFAASILDYKFIH